MANKVDADGIEINTFDENKAEIIQTYQDALGSDIRTDAGSVFGTLISGQALRQTQIYTLLNDLFYQLNPQTSQGNCQNFIGSLMYTKRNSASKSTVTIEFTANASGLTVPEGELYDNTWQAETTVNINPNDVGSVPFVAVEDGVIVAGANTLTDPTKINLSGIASLTNPLKAREGNLRGSDAQYRAEMLNSSARPSPTKAGANKALNEVDGVKDAVVIFSEKAGDTGDTLGIPIGECLPIIEGGSDVDIATALATKAIAGGIPTISDNTIVSGLPALQEVEYPDPVTGQVYEFYYAPAVLVPVTITITYTLLKTAGSVQQQVRRQLIDNWLPDQSKLGADLNVQTMFEYIVNDLFQIIRIASITVQRKSGGASFTDILPVNAWEKFTIEDETDITVSIVP